MAADFHLIDLVSQCAAVERLLGSMSEPQKIDWLSARGRLARFPVHAGPQVFEFTSTVGREARFFFATGFSYSWVTTRPFAQTRQPRQVEPRISQCDDVTRGVKVLLHDSSGAHH